MLPLFVLVALALPVVYAQSIIRPPLVGALVDPTSRKLHWLEGIPGAAVRTGAVDLGWCARIAEVSPDRSLIAGIECDTGNLLIRSMRSLASVSRVPLGAASDVVLRFSPSGRALVVHSPDRLTIIAGLDASPRVAGSMDGAASLALVNDDASLLLKVRDGRVELLDVPSAASLAPMPLEDVRAAAFLDRPDEALIATATGLYWARDLTRLPVLVLLAGPREGVDDPIAVAALPAQRHVFFFNRNSRSIVSVPLDDQGPRATLVACPCEITRLQPLGPEGMFLISDPSKDPLWLLDVQNSRPRVVFVPFAAPQEVER